MTARKFVPARPTESAVSYDLMRAALWTLVASRPSHSITITERQRERLGGKAPSLLRLTLDMDMTIHMWLEEPQSKQRQGVTYVHEDRRR